MEYKWQNLSDNFRHVKYSDIILYLFEEHQSEILKKFPWAEIIIPQFRVIHTPDFNSGMIIPNKDLKTLFVVIEFNQVPSPSELKERLEVVIRFGLNQIHLP